MKTIAMAIGNSDDKLTQAEWAEFVRRMDTVIAQRCTEKHFFGGPANWAPWQNVMWLFTIDEGATEALKADCVAIRAHYRQSYIALIEGETEFI